MEASWLEGFLKLLLHQEIKFLCVPFAHNNQPFKISVFGVFLKISSSK